MREQGENFLKNCPEPLPGFKLCEFRMFTEVGRMMAINKQAKTKPMPTKS